MPAEQKNKTERNRSISVTFQSVISLAPPSLCPGRHGKGEKPPRGAERSRSMDEKQSRADAAQRKSNQLGRRMIPPPATDRPTSGEIGDALSRLCVGPLPEPPAAATATFSITDDDDEPCRDDAQSARAASSWQTDCCCC